MKCMCAQTRRQFILSSERVFEGMEFEPTLPPREKSPLPENFHQGRIEPATLWTASPNTTNELFRPQNSTIILLLYVGSSLAAAGKSRLHWTASLVPIAGLCKYHVYTLTLNVLCHTTPHKLQSRTARSKQYQLLQFEIF